MAKERLTEERKQQLSQLFHDLRRHNFYSVLGVTGEASRADIRRGYFAISKLCHPDNYREVDLGEYRQYMEKIFQACSKAYDVLSNAKKRQRYDEYLAKKADTAQYATNLLGQSASRSSPPETSSGDRSLRREVREVRSVRSPGPVDVDSLPPVQSPQARQEQVPGPIASVPSVAPPVSAERARAHAERRRNWRKSSARRGLLGALGDVENIQRSRKGRTWMEQATKAKEDGDVIGALNALRMAVNSDPDSKEARAMLQETMSTASGDLGMRYLDQARAELEFGERQLAQASIARAMEHCPENPDIQAMAAKILLESDGDMHRAYEAIQRASRAQPENVAHLVLMGKILLKAGLTSRARSVLTKASEMDPDSEDAKVILSRM